MVYIRLHFFPAIYCTVLTGWTVSGFFPSYLCLDSIFLECSHSWYCYRMIQTALLLYSDRDWKRTGTPNGIDVLPSGSNAWLLTLRSETGIDVATPANVAGPLIDWHQSQRVQTLLRQSSPPDWCCRLRLGLSNKTVTSSFFMLGHSDGVCCLEWRKNLPCYYG